MTGCAGLLYLWFSYTVLVSAFPTDEGVFEISVPDWIPWKPNDSYNSSDDVEVEFYLFTKDTIDSPLISKIDDQLLFNGLLQKNKELKILIHGWMDTWKKPFAQVMMHTYLPQFDYNVVIVNWPEACAWNYISSRLKVPVVGKIVARFLDRLNREYFVDTKSVHIVGHSLGAHVAGVAGYHAAERLGKITGLDPAFPLFTTTASDALRKDAADFVEILHTCGLALGIFDAIGHVDFYANEGIPNQPGCGLNLRCSHIRSFYLYAESIKRPLSFVATKCDSWKTYSSEGCKHNDEIVMNGNTPNNARGVFYFKTAASPPYGLGPTLYFSDETLQKAINQPPILWRSSFA